MSRLLFVLIGLVTLVTVNGDQPLWMTEFDEPIDETTITSRNDESYRLPQNVFPIQYDIYIDLYFQEREDRPFTYDGREYIIIQAVEENVTQIVLHANVDSINGVNLLQDDGTPIALDTENPLVLEPEYHFMRVNLANILIPGDNYTLFIDYSSTMNEGPMKRGIWMGWYEDENNVERIYAATHFQPYNARQAFPCWDEPLFKAVFQLHLSKPRSYSATFSNTELSTFDFQESNRIQYNFRPTPKMSSYLVTFLVSESFEVIAQNTTYNPPIRVIGRSNAAGLGDHALNLAVKMTDFFDEYFGIPYSTLHPNLLNDHIASPDWASAGTENWGMVSYRELHLIVDERETIMSVEHYSATLVSHELAHKWFGNLITCYWWSNTWINEGFASYFGYIATNEMFPSYEFPDHFNTRYLQTSLSFDSGTSTVPLNHDVNTPAQVTGHFGTISYSKAASFLRMTVNIITPETFRKACQYFLLDNAYLPTNQTHLYDAFVKAIDEDNSLEIYTNFDFAEYYRVWVNEPGYPLLSVEVNYATGEITLSQERFYLSASATPSAQVYPLPITYSTKSNPQFTNLRPARIMSTQTGSLFIDPGEEWVIFNNLQQGHYRVNYDDRTWELITEALLDDLKPIHYSNRAQIVDDVFALMRSTRMTFGKGFRILRFLNTEDNYHVWSSAITGFTWLRSRFRNIPDSLANFDSFILSNMEHVIDFVGFDPTDSESSTTSLLRQDILHFACTLGHNQCVTDSRNRFINMRNGDWIDPRIRRSVYVNGIREGELEDFVFLLDRFLGSNIANDQLEMLRGLAATTDSELLTRYLDLTLTKYVRTHDKVTSFNYALLGHPGNAYTALQFIKQHIDELRIAYIEDSPANPVHSVLSNLASYLDEAGLQEYESWLRSTQTNIPQFNTAISAINSARINNAWGAANADDILTAARGGATELAASMSLLILMGIVIIKA